MSNENYVNYYIETMVGKINETTMETIQLKTNARISQEIIDRFAKENENYKLTTDTFIKLQSDKAEEFQGLQNFSSSQAHEIQELKNKINELSNHVTELVEISNQNDKLSSDFVNIHNEKNQLEQEYTAIKLENENNKNQLQHLETFRNELTKARQDIEILTEKSMKDDYIIKEYEDKILDLTNKFDVVNNSIKSNDVNKYVKPNNISTKGKIKKSKSSLKDDDF